MWSDVVLQYGQADGDDHLRALATFGGQLAAVQGAIDRSCCDSSSNFCVVPCHLYTGPSNLGTLAGE